MSVRSIEAEVSIKSGVQAECTIGREVIVEVHDEVNLESLKVTANGSYEPSEGVDGFSDVSVNVPPTIPDIEPLTVTANGTYTAEGDGFNPVTVNIDTPTDPNVYEGEFIGTETGVLTIDTGYDGDGFPKGILIHPVSGVMGLDDEFFNSAPTFSVNFLSLVKNTNRNYPTYPSTPSGEENQMRMLVLYKSGRSNYVSSTSVAYVFSTASNESVYGFPNSIRMPDNHTLKIFVASSQSGSNAFLPTGIRYKYKVFY